MVDGLLLQISPLTIKQQKTPNANLKSTIEGADLGKKRCDMQHYGSSVLTLSLFAFQGRMMHYTCYSMNNKSC